MVITPIEEMMTKVKRISENPLKAQQEEENEQLTIDETNIFVTWEPIKFVEPYEPF